MKKSSTFWNTMTDIAIGTTIAIGATAVALSSMTMVKQEIETLPRDIERWYKFDFTNEYNYKQSRNRFDNKKIMELIVIKNNVEGIIKSINDIALLPTTTATIEDLNDRLNFMKNLVKDLDELRTTMKNV